LMNLALKSQHMHLIRVFEQRMNDMEKNESFQVWKSVIAKL
jgi:TPP-dependent pyruvate/acetoin dehydrogenase alpha subunit